MLTKRNIRVLSITGVLLFLVFFIVNNANNNAGLIESINSNAQPKAETSTTEKSDPKVQQEIDNIKQEIGITGDSKGTPASTTKTEEPEVFDPAKEYNSILGNSPMIVFSKTRCPYSRKLKELLEEEYVFTPNYAVVELDKHEHGSALQEYISGQTGRGTVPNVIINGISRGGYDDFNKLHSNNALLDSLQEWGEKSLKVTQNEKPSNN